MQRILALTLLFGVPAASGAQEIHGGYVGISAGSFAYEEGSDVGLDISDRTSTYRIFGGYQFNSVYAVEAGWGATGDIEETFRGFDPTVGDVSLVIRGDYEITTLRFMAIAPISNVNMFGGVGYFDAKIGRSLRFESPVEVITDSGEDSDSGATVVGGMQWELDRIAIRGEYEWFDTDDVDAAAFNVGVLLRF